MQFGFRKKFDTLNAIFFLNIYDSPNNNHVMIAAYLDFSKIFEMVETVLETVMRLLLIYTGLIIMLCYKGHFIQLVCLISQRRQLVSINSNNFLTSSLQSGVPQGSILGSLYIHSKVYTTES